MRFDKALYEENSSNSDLEKTFLWNNLLIKIKICCLEIEIVTWKYNFLFQRWVVGESAFQQWVYHHIHRTSMSLLIAQQRILE